MDLLAVRTRLSRGAKGPRLDVDLVVDRWYGGGPVQGSRAHCTMHLDDRRGRPRYTLTHRGARMWLRDLRTGSWTDLHQLYSVETSRPDRQVVSFYVRAARLPAVRDGVRVGATVTLSDPRTGRVQTRDASATTPTVRAR